MPSVRPHHSQQAWKSQILVVDMIFAPVCNVLCVIMEAFIGSPSLPIVSEHSGSSDNNWTLSTALNRVAIIIICWLPRPVCPHSALTPHKFHRLIPVSSLCRPYVVTSVETGDSLPQVSGLWWSCWCEAPGAVSAHYLVSLHDGISQWEATIERHQPIRELIMTLFFCQATLYTLYTGCWCEIAAIGRQLGPSYSCEEPIRGQ